MHYVFMSSVRVSVRDVVSVLSLVCIDDFHHTFVPVASWDEDELNWLGFGVKGQGHSMLAG